MTQQPCVNALVPWGSRREVVPQTDQHVWWADWCWTSWRIVLVLKHVGIQVEHFYFESCRFNVKSLWDRKHRRQSDGVPRPQSPHTPQMWATVTVALRPHWWAASTRLQTDLQSFNTLLFGFDQATCPPLHHDIYSLFIARSSNTTTIIQTSHSRDIMRSSCVRCRPGLNQTFQLIGPSSVDTPTPSWTAWRGNHFMSSSQKNSRFRGEPHRTMR